MTFLKEVFSVHEQEEVLLITDDEYIAATVAQECKDLGANLNLFQILDQQRPIKRLSPVLASAIASSNVILTPFRDLSEEGAFRIQMVGAATKNTASRLAHMPGVNKDVFQNCVLKTDYEEIERLGIELVQVLARARSCVLTSAKGTELKMNLGGWLNKADAGIGNIKYYGSWENLPSGEAFKIPVEGTTEGRLVVDGAVPGKVLDQEENERIIFKITKGRITRIEDYSNLEFEKMLNEIDHIDPDLRGNIYKIAELGIGTNRAARITPFAIEFEKVLGTVHVAIGENRFFGGGIAARRHIDMMVLSPSLTIDGTELIREGKLSKSAIKDLIEENFSDYKSYSRRRLKPERRIYPAREIGGCEIKDDMLYRTWKSPTGRIFQTRIGNARTSQVICKVWVLIKNKPQNVESLAKNLKIPHSDCIKLVKMLRDFGVVEISQ